MPERLLTLLRASPQSGEALGTRLGVGRVTVGTLARRLQADGVPVVILRSGYALAAGTPAPALLSALLPAGTTFGHTLRYRGTVGSTQDEVRTWADDPQHPAPHGAVMVAERQTAGRGRRGRTWDTTHGTLVFSVLLRGLTLPETALVPLAAGVALHEVCAGLGVPCGLKWPNDLLTRTGGRKLAGILLEADLRGEEVRRAVLGIGLNVSAAPEGAAALTDWTPAPPSRAAVLAALLPALECWLTAPAPDILDGWRQASLTLGQQVQVQTPRGPVAGVALDIDAQGSLLLQPFSGNVITVSAGDVQLVGALPASPLSLALPGP